MILHLAFPKVTLASLSDAEDVMNEIEQDIATVKRNIAWCENEIQHLSRVVFLATNKEAIKRAKGNLRDMNTQLKVLKLQLKSLEKQIHVYRF